MRWSFWRRTLTALALIAGIGVGASAPATAQPVTSHTSASAVRTIHALDADWWW
jgi:hypothetical protein